jgi:hypothetical protein
MALINPQMFTNPALFLTTQYGIPKCATNFGVDVLQFMGGGSLNALTRALQQGRNTARQTVADFVNKVFNDTGIISFNVGTGKFELFSQSSTNGFDIDWLETAANWTGQINAFFEAGEALVEGFEEVQDCLAQFGAWLDSGGPLDQAGFGGINSTYGGNQYTENSKQAAFALAQSQIQDALDFAGKCSDQLEIIGQILYQRQLEAAAAAEDEGPIFRLTFGPPVSKQGLFILSEDGLYFDSQERLYNGKEIPSASDIGFVVDSEKWNLNYPPSLGGKGTIITVDQLNDYVNTIFDLSYIDNSTELQTFYAKDYFLAVLQEQKDKLVSDSESQVTELLSDGYTEDSALVVNTKQSLFSVISSYGEKEDKRKKQIEIAVKSADLLGSSEVFEPGQIPVNDFSFLSSVAVNIPIDKQKQLSFDSGEVSGVVLPIKPKFVRNYGTNSNALLSPVVVPPVGLGSIIFNPSINAQSAPAVSLTDSISTSGLFAVYNFLKGNTLDPSSTQYNVVNPANPGADLDGQLVGVAQNVFKAGLGVPFLGGITKIDTTTANITKSAGYFRLPSSKEFQNLMYNPDGCSIDCWLHIPYFAYNQTRQEEDPTAPARLKNANTGAWTDYNYYRILLGNENTGGLPQASNVSSLTTSNQKETTKGVLIGFTRDPVIFSDQAIIPGPNTNPGQNANLASSATVSSSCFFIAPTQSFGTSAVEFVPKVSDCSFTGFHKMKVDVSSTLSNGKSLSDVSSTYIHLHIALNVPKDECNIYLDGSLLSTSAISDVFGVQSFTSPKVPTFIVPKDKPNSSFYYSSATVNQAPGVTSFDSGPQNDTYFTPWIVGGGWTEGSPIDFSTSSGGFMGNRHGYTGSLHGHVGSLKFYSRPLTTKEVLQNYEAQSGFFKNIEI